MARKLFSGLLLVIILVAIACIIWLAAVPQKRDSFTEFYLLGSDGKADSYPTNLRVGEKASVLVGIVNKEFAETTYHLSVRSDNTSLNEIDQIVLSNSQKWEQPVTFAMKNRGNYQKVNFLLYKMGQSDPCRTLNLIVNVMQ